MLHNFYLPEDLPYEGSEWEVASGVWYTGGMKNIEQHIQDEKGFSCDSCPCAGLCTVACRCTIAGGCDFCGCERSEKLL